MQRRYLNTAVVDLHVKSSDSRIFSEVSKLIDSLFDVDQRLGRMLGCYLDHLSGLHHQQSRNQHK